MPTPDERDETRTFDGKLDEDAIRTLVYIGELTSERDSVNAQLREHVAYARQQGASWRMIGVALGVTAQSAWERYSGHERDSEIPRQLELPEVTDQSSWLNEAAGALTMSREWERPLPD